MKTLILLACMLGSLLWSGSAYASFDGSPEVPVLVQNADAVCVVKVVAITGVVPTQFEAVHKDRNGLPIFVDAESAVAEAIVQNVLVGAISQKSIKISFFKNVSHGFNPTPFTELMPGETDIVFLKTTSEDAHYALSQPSSHGKSKITIGDIKIGQGLLTALPLRSTLLTLVDAVNNGDKLVRLECLNRIGSIGYLLYVKVGVYQDEGAVTTRLKLEEPLLLDTDPTSLEHFVKTQILPAVLKLTAEKDQDVHKQAFFTAAQLQDIAVIPELVQIADVDYKPDELGEAALLVGEYKNPAALRALISALNNSSNHVRYSAIDSLREINDPLALPFLIERLDDKDAEVREIASQALFTLTGEVGSSLPPGDADSLQTREIAFWKKWAAAHPDKIKALRAQFDSASPVPAAS